VVAAPAAVLPAVEDTAAAVLVAAPVVGEGHPAVGNRFFCSAVYYFPNGTVTEKWGYKAKSYYILCFSQICYNI
jgi:hypothetical protein